MLYFLGAVISLITIVDAVKTGRIRYLATNAEWKKKPIVFMSLFIFPIILLLFCLLVLFDVIDPDSLPQVRVSRD